MRSRGCQTRIEIRGTGTEHSDGKLTFHVPYLKFQISNSSCHFPYFKSQISNLKFVISDFTFPFPD